MANDLTFSEATGDVEGDVTGDEPFINTVLDYISRGIPVFPCKASGAKLKMPLTKNGFLDATTNQTQILQWWLRSRNALIGMPTGAASGFIVLDVDVDEAKGKDGEASLRDLLQKHNEQLPVTSVARTPRGGRHIYFRHPGIRVPSRTNFLGKHLDIRGDGGYVILPPSISTVGPYVWEGEVEAAEMPDWLLELLTADNSKPTSAIPTASVSTDDSKIRSALSSISAEDRGVWFKVGCALKSHYGDSGWQLFDDWSKTAPESYDEVQNRGQWDTFKADGGIKIATVFHLAKESKSHRASKKSAGVYHEYLGDGEQSSPAIADQPTLMEKLASRMYSADVKPTVPEPLFLLGGVPTCTAGNITTMSAAPKAGKSTTVNAMLASTFCVSSADCLGFTSSNPHGKAVLHLDSEQCPYDHWEGVQRTIRRAKVDAAPRWLLSYCLTGFPTAEFRASIPILIGQAAENHGGIHSVFIDGVADAVDDVNDPGETSSLVTELHNLAIQHDCPIICIIHVNPGSDFKTRGHLGSQLERKSETNLRLEKDDSGATVIFADKNRRAPIPKATAPRFAWSDDVAMHVSIVSLQTSKDSADKTGLRIEAQTVFASTTQTMLSHGQFIELLEKTVCRSKSTAKRHLTQMLRIGIVQRNLDGTYSLKP